MAERRAEDEAAAVEVEHAGRRGGLLADHQCLHAAGVDRADLDPGGNVEVRQQRLVGGALLLQVADVAQPVRDRLPQAGDPAHDLAADGLHRGDGLVDVAQQPARALEQRLAGDGELDAARGAAQQLAPHELLERADLAAEGGLGDVQPLCGASEVQLLRDGDEGPQVAQLDRVGRGREGEHSGGFGHDVDYGPAPPTPAMPIGHECDVRSAFPCGARRRHHRRHLDPTYEEAAMRRASADGTQIAFSRAGHGPPLILVDGALCHRGAGPNRALARRLSRDFTVLTYDRRGRGESGDTGPYAVEREIQDIATLVETVGGPVSLYGISSGGLLALEAAARLADDVARLVLHEIPFVVDETRPPVPQELAAQLAEVLPTAQHRTLDGQTHYAKADALAPVLTEFFTGTTSHCVRRGRARQLAEV
jgi:hypothetical protein